jgi:hypothetical protein
VDDTLNVSTAALLLLADALAVVDATRQCRGKRLGVDPFAGSIHPRPKGGDSYSSATRKRHLVSNRFLDSFFLFPRARARERRRALFHAGLRAVWYPTQFSLFSGLLCLFSG